MGKIEGSDGALSGATPTQRTADWALAVKAARSQRLAIDGNASEEERCDEERREKLRSAAQLAVRFKLPSFTRPLRKTA